MMFGASKMTRQNQLFWGLNFFFFPSFERNRFWLLTFCVVKNRFQYKHDAPITYPMATWFVIFQRKPSPLINPHGSRIFCLVFFLQDGELLQALFRSGVRIAYRPDTSTQVSLWHLFMANAFFNGFIFHMKENYLNSELTQNWPSLYFNIGQIYS